MNPWATPVTDARNRAVKITSRAEALAAAHRAGLVVIDGDDASYWLVNRADARRLMLAGFARVWS